MSFDAIIFGAVGRLCQRKCLVQSKSASAYMLKRQVQLLSSESVKDTVIVTVECTKHIKMQSGIHRATLPGLDCTFSCISNC